MNQVWRWLLNKSISAAPAMAGVALIGVVAVQQINHTNTLNTAALGLLISDKIADAGKIRTVVVFPAAPSREMIQTALDTCPVGAEYGSCTLQFPDGGAKILLDGPIIFEPRGLRVNFQGTTTFTANENFSGAGLLYFGRKEDAQPFIDGLTLTNFGVGIIAGSSTTVDQLDVDAGPDPCTREALNKIAGLGSFCRRNQDGTTSVMSQDWRVIVKDVRSR